MDYKLRALATYPQPTVGFHIRGGDKGEEDVLQVRLISLPSVHSQYYSHALRMAGHCKMHGGNCTPECAGY